MAVRIAPLPLMTEQEVAARAKSRAEEVGFQRRLYLIKNGIPYEVAFKLSEVEAIAMAVVFGEQVGGRFCWDTMSWLS